MRFCPSGILSWWGMSSWVLSSGILSRGISSWKVFVLYFCREGFVVVKFLHK